MKKFGVLTILVLGLGAYPFNAKADPPAFAGEPALAVEASVDLAYCGSGGVQCTVTHAAGAASSSNHNPVRLFVLVSKRNGEGVSGLSDTDFTFVNTFVSAGGGSSGLCDSIDCGVDNFQDNGTGLYAMFLDVIPDATNWGAGTRGATVAVSFMEDGKTFDGIGGALCRWSSRR